MPSQNFLQYQKSFLRVIYKQIIAKLDEGSIEAVVSEWKRGLLDYIQKGAYTKIALYYPINHEVNISPIIEEFAILCEVFLPVIVSRSEPLKFARYEKNQLHCSKIFSKIMEPDSNVFDIPEVIIVPGICFDKNYNRIGSGAGLYDRTMKLYRKSYNAKFISLALKLQMLDSLPAEDHDELLDYVIVAQSV